MHKYIYIILFSSLLLFSFACKEKVEEKTAAPVVKVEEALPAVTQERIDIALKVTVGVGEYIGKFALKNEEIKEQRDVVTLVHSSPRNQYIYGEVFKEEGMSTKEFWNIFGEMERAKKYLQLKEDESLQKAQLNELIEAGKEEIKALEESIASGADPEEVEDTISMMKEKIEEFSGLRGNVKPGDVGIDQEMVDLWLINKEKINTALDSMWKIDKTRGKEEYRHQ